MSTQYRRFINGIENFTRIKGSLFSFVVLVAKLETRTRDANTLIAINRGYLENGKGKGREGVIKVVDSSFRFTRVVRFGATGQFFVPREPLVSRSTISTRPVISRHVHTCISLFLKSINPDGGYLPSVVRLLRVPFLTSSVVQSCPLRFLSLFEDRVVPFYGKKKWNRVEKWTR